jgi:hypothetical protein
MLNWSSITAKKQRREPRLVPLTEEKRMYEPLRDVGVVVVVVVKRSGIIIAKCRGVGPGSVESAYFRTVQNNTTQHNTLHDKFGDGTRCTLYTTTARN